MTFISERIRTAWLEAHPGNCEPDYMAQAAVTLDSPHAEIRLQAYRAHFDLLKIEADETGLDDAVRFATLQNLFTRYDGDAVVWNAKESFLRNIRLGLNAEAGESHATIANVLRKDMLMAMFSCAEKMLYEKGTPERLWDLQNWVSPAGVHALVDTLIADSKQSLPLPHVAKLRVFSGRHHVTWLNAFIKLGYQAFAQRKATYHLTAIADEAQLNIFKTILSKYIKAEEDCLHRSQKHILTEQAIIQERILCDETSARTEGKRRPTPCIKGLLLNLKLQGLAKSSL